MSSKSEETRIRILNATWKLLEGGDTIIRMSDIAKKAGISRQALYLHFPKRVELLIATTRHIDDVKDVDARLALSRTAKSGEERLDAFIEAWGNYIPEIYGVAKALMAMQDSDEEARQAWSDRMYAVKHGCEAAVRMLEEEGKLSAPWTGRQANDLLWSILSVRNWEQLLQQSEWSQEEFVKSTKLLARRALISGLSDSPPCPAQPESL